MLLTPVRGLMTPLITTHESPSGRTSRMRASRTGRWSWRPSTRLVPRQVSVLGFNMESSGFRASRVQAGIRFRHRGLHIH